MKFFNRVRGYGFIKPDDGGPELFVHYSSVEGKEGRKHLHEGEAVEFEIKDGDHGPEAVSVTKVDRRDTISPSGGLR